MTQQILFFDNRFPTNALITNREQSQFVHQPSIIELQDQLFKVVGRGFEHGYRTLHHSATSNNLHKSSSTWDRGGGQNIDKRRGPTVQNAKLCSNPNPFGNLLVFSRTGKTGFLRPRHIHCESGPSHKILSSFRACNKTPAAPERALHKNMTGMRGSDSPGLNSVPDMNWRY